MSGNGTVPARFAPACFGLFALAFTAIWLYTLPDYGMMWDAWEYYAGDKYLHFYRSLDWGALDFARDDIGLYHRPDHPNFHAVTAAYRDVDLNRAPHLVWAFGPFTSSLSKYLLYGVLHLFDPLDAHHGILLLWGLLLLAALFHHARGRYGQWAAFAACLVTACYPRFWAELHNNVKDVPAAVLFTLTILAFGRGCERRDWRWLLGAAGLWGLSLATKPNGLFLPLILGPWWLANLWEQRRTHGLGLDRPTLAALLAFPWLGLAVMFLAWPLLLSRFPHEFSLYVQSLLSRGYQGERQWQWQPLLNALATMPPTVMALALLGLAGIAVNTWRTRRLLATHLLLLLWVSVPVLRVCLPGARDFDGIRHWLEFVPALALLAGIGLQSLRDLAWARLPRLRQLPAPARRTLGLAALLAFMAPVLAWDWRVHPNQIVYYNRFVGGLPGAQRRGFPESCDYWANSYRQGFDWLNQHAPAESRVMIGVAEHIGFYSQACWLRHDLELVPTVGQAPAALRRRAAAGPSYLMYVTRQDWYHPLVRELDGRQPPVFEVLVEGVPILKILEVPPPQP